MKVCQIGLVSFFAIFDLFAYDYNHHITIIVVSLLASTELICLETKEIHYALQGDEPPIVLKNCYYIQYVTITSGNGSVRRKYFKDYNWVKRKSSYYNLSKCIFQ